MAALRLGVCKAMTEGVLSSLQTARIRTVTDFVSKNPEEIAQICSIPYKDVLSIRRVLLAQYSAFPVLASQLYTNALSNLAIICTGISELDQLLDGGLYGGEVCELAGETAAGKTQVCLRCAATVACVHAQNVVYIDTCGSSSAERLVDFIPGFDHSEQTSGFYRSVKMLILDNVAAVFYPVLGGQQMDSVALLEQIGQRLKQLAMDFCLAVLVTNNVTSGLDGERRPSLGRLWAHVPHTRIILERTLAQSEQTCRQATLVKSVRMKTPASATFNLAVCEQEAPG
ncbi:hypothetical protein BaRGS_00033300 [Batillaria attramentaria]|uniref:RecA family profile 1 domain-containing protein n=1 Tax=Batillaria attramentaria TaxID=370345 RepID=A0ABD0JKU4_9CAEN